LDSPIDPRFGRCQYFLIVDKNDNLDEAVPNPGIQAIRGAGTQAAQIVAGKGANIVITGNIGPNAFVALQASGIRIFVGAFGITARQALQMYKNGQLQEVQSPTAPGHFGSSPRGGFGMGRGQGGRGGRGGPR